MTTSKWLNCGIVSNASIIFCNLLPFSEFLQKYTPKVERLGFDENYLDVTDMVEQRLALNDDAHQAGFVYGAETGTQGIDWHHIKATVITWQSWFDK